MDKLTELISDIDGEAVKNLLVFDHQNPLLFNTGLFLLLFIGLLLIYQLMRRWRTAKMLVVIFFSLYFYYKSSSWYCLILLGVCFFDYFLGLWMQRTENNTVRRLIVALNVVANV